MHYGSADVYTQHTKNTKDELKLSWLYSLGGRKDIHK